MPNINELTNTINLVALGEVNISKFNTLLKQFTGAELNQADNNGWTPLALTAVHNRVDMLSGLLAMEGIDVNFSVKNIRIIPSFKYLQNMQKRKVLSDKIKKLQEDLKKPQFQEEGIFPICFAAAQYYDKEDSAAIQKLLDHGANIYFGYPGAKLLSPRLLAGAIDEIYDENDKLFAIFFNSIKDPSKYYITEGEKKIPLLHYAARSANCDVVKFLLSTNKIDIHEKYKDENKDKLATQMAGEELYHFFWKKKFHRGYDESFKHRYVNVVLTIIHHVTPKHKTKWEEIRPKVSRIFVENLSHFAMISPDIHTLVLMYKLFLEPTTSTAYAMDAVLNNNEILHGFMIQVFTLLEGRLLKEKSDVINAFRALNIANSEQWIDFSTVEKFISCVDTIVNFKIVANDKNEIVHTQKDSTSPHRGDQFYDSMLSQTFNFIFGHIVDVLKINLYNTFVNMKDSIKHFNFDQMPVQTIQLYLKTVQKCRDSLSNKKSWFYYQGLTKQTEDALGELIQKTMPILLKHLQQNNVNLAVKEASSAAAMPLKNSSNEPDINSLIIMIDYVAHRKATLDQFQKLLECFTGTALNQANLEGWTPLTLAIIREQIDIVKALLNKPDIDANFLVRTIKKIPVSYGDQKKWEYLVGHLRLMQGNLSNPSPSKGVSPFYFAMLLHAGEIMEILIKHGANIKNTCPGTANLMPPIAFACSDPSRAQAILPILLQNTSKADLAEPMVTGSPPALHYAASCGNVVAVKLLLASGKVDVNQKMDELLPLEYALGDRHVNAVIAFIHHADPTTQTIMPPSQYEMGLMCLANKVVNDTKKLANLYKIFSGKSSEIYQACNHFEVEFKDLISKSRENKKAIYQIKIFQTWEEKNKSEKFIDFSTMVNFFSSIEVITATHFSKDDASPKNRTKRRENDPVLLEQANALIENAPAFIEQASALIEKSNSIAVQNLLNNALLVLKTNFYNSFITLKKNIKHFETDKMSLEMLQKYLKAIKQCKDLISKTISWFGSSSLVDNALKAVNELIAETEKLEKIKISELQKITPEKYDKLLVELEIEKRNAAKWQAENAMLKKLNFEAQTNQECVEKNLDKLQKILSKKSDEEKALKSEIEKLKAENTMFQQSMLQLASKLQRSEIQIQDLTHSLGDTQAELATTKKELTDRKSVQESTKADLISEKKSHQLTQQKLKVAQKFNRTLLQESTPHHAAAPLTNGNTLFGIPITQQSASTPAEDATKKSMENIILEYQHLFKNFREYLDRQNFALSDMQKVRTFQEGYIVGLQQENQLLRTQQSVPLTFFQPLQVIPTVSAAIAPTDVKLPLEIVDSFDLLAMCGVFDAQLCGSTVPYLLSQREMFIKDYDFVGTCPDQSLLIKNEFKAIPYKLKACDGTLYRRGNIDFLCVPGERLNLEEDCKNRAFNVLYCDRNGKLSDPSGMGLQAALEGKITLGTDPLPRLINDPRLVLYALDFEARGDGRWIDQPLRNALLQFDPSWVTNEHKLGFYKTLQKCRDNPITGDMFLWLIIKYEIFQKLDSHDLQSKETVSAQQQHI
jgi:ankyrin repeat protein